MYESVHAVPDGDSTVARFAATAAEYGFDGIVVRNHGDSRGEFDAEQVSDEYDVDVVDGLEIRADNPSQASGHVGNFRPKATILLFHGGTSKLNRFAVEEERIDVLAHPMQGRGDFNHVLAKAAKEHGVRVEFNFSRVLRADGGQRVQAIKDLRKLREIVTKYDAPFVVSADAHSHLQLRAPRELVAVGETIGFSAEQVETGLKEWGELAERNRAIRSDDFIAPGVKRGRYEEDD
ncbi:ribonuclease P/MRP protein subunit RPP1 [Haladaptatus litoreus]|uniref:Ribonuclease P protein component 3 n=1 Tax=Haladaptatus litoreus TaxID=553468 RepID=A0A1N6YGW7_9EURY|nr:RNase P subunit p30 family protein [Haladaptatus litoreus]SIR13885.1 ribonuclease P/MRP protein subunit RPP1 [Haladaptatus litoreus]